MEETLNTIQGSKGMHSTGIGERLRTARQDLRLSEKEAAARLNLNTNLIYIMENENFHQGPPATFMRGYLRSYGRLLNFKESEINLALNELNLSLPQNTITPATNLPKKAVSQLDRYLRWSSYFVISLLLGLVIIWWSSHPRYNEIEQVAQNTMPAETIPTPQINAAPVTAVLPENKPADHPSPLAEQASTKILNPPAAPPISTPTTQSTPAKPIAENINDVDDTNEENVY